MEFRLGDKVWSYSRQEWGEVKVVDNNCVYALRVYFAPNSYEYYTADGKLFSHHKAPDLFHDKVTITPPPRPLPDIPVDTKMLVWDDGSIKKSKRHFARWENGRCFCWAGGRTSFTADSKYGTPCFDNWEIIELTSEGRKSNNDKTPELFRQS